MYIGFIRLLLLLVILVSGSSYACDEKEDCIAQSSWQLGIAIGLGVKTNPLVDGDNIPLVILPDIAWYAEKAYFDNGELGYQWLNQTKYSVETFINIDRESAYFSFFHPANILLPIDNSIATVSPGTPGSSDAIDSPDSNENSVIDNQRSLSIDDIASRKWAINAGIRGHYFVSNGEWQLTLLQDISNVHQGQSMGLQYSHRWQWRDVRIGMRIGTEWKSADLIDYYYGVSQRDTEHSDFYFKGNAGLQTYMAISVQKPINKNWSWLANIGYRRLPDSLVDSPLIERNNIRNAFLGVAYRF